MGVISGSSSNVRALAYNEIQEEHYLRYPNLNHTLYMEIHLNPLRTEVEFRQFLQAKGLTDIDPFQLFQMTGGVGRYMNRVIIKESLDIKYSDIIRKMELDSIFRAVVGLIYNKYLMRKDSSSMTWTQSRISFAEVRKLGALLFVNKWGDEGFLYECELSYELLIPNYLKYIQNYFLKKPNHLRSIAFETTIQGWEGHGSGRKVLESYIIERFIQSDIEPFEGRQFSDDQISVAETTSNSISASGATILSLTNTKLEYLLNRVVSVTNDSGIDAVILDSNESNENVIDITAIQIKSGMLKESITMGKLNRNPNSSRHFVAILTKANKGCVNLSRLLHDNFKNSKFRINKFVLLTSKNVHKDIEDLRSVNIGGDEVSFTCLHQPQFVKIFKDELERRNLV